MRKYLLPSAICLALGLGFAVAQNITKGLQVSQDPTGAFGVDTSNNVYFPAHVLNTGLAPTFGTCGGGTPSIVGSDFAGEITTGTATATCNIAFRSAYVATPWCVLSSQNFVTATPTGYSVSPSGITFTQLSASTVKVNYICSGSK